MKSDLQINIAYCFLTSVTAFIFIPTLMIGSSPADYRFVDFGVLFRSGALFSLIFALSLTIGCLALHFLRLGILARYFSLFAFIWVMAAGFFFPTSVSTGMVDPENNPVDKFNVFITFSLASGLALAGLTQLIKYINIFAAVVIITSITPALSSIYNSEIWRSSSTSDHPSLTLSDKRNVLVISFDGLPGTVVKEVIQGDSEFRSAFKDFTYFDNVTSQSPATQASQMGELYGIRDYKSMGARRQDVLETLSEQGLRDKLLTNQVADSYIHGYIDTQAKQLSIPTPEQVAQGRNSTFDFFRYPIVRLWTSHAARILEWNEKTDSFRKLVVGAQESFDLVERSRNHLGPKWDAQYILDMATYRAFVKHLSASNKDFSLRQLHFVFSHFPVDFDENCEYFGDDEEKYEASQNRDGLTAQTECAVQLFTTLLTKLQELEIYSQSLIVFKSDHGEPAEYFSDYPNNLIINDNKLWGYNRYRPVLMIKGVGANNSEINFRSELVLINDLALTLCKHADQDLDCSHFPGIDLLADDLKSSAPYYLYVSENSESTFKFESHISVSVPSREISPLQALTNSKNVLLTEYPGSKSQNSPDTKTDDSDERMQYLKIRLADLNRIKSALSGYYSEHGNYPVSNDWSGVYSNFGESKANYIEGLAPDFIESLPVDPRKSTDGGENYLYRSDGKEFKFIVQGAPAYDLEHIPNDLLDERRPTWAYGVWSKGAADW